MRTTQYHADLPTGSLTDPLHARAFLTGRLLDIALDSAKTGGDPAGAFHALAPIAGWWTGRAIIRADWSTFLLNPASGTPRLLFRMRSLWLCGLIPGQSAGTL